ncbi:NifB/NifX family molybdenum-iron cluster-binding protein [Patescibacteria group bacterium]
MPRLNKKGPLGYGPGSGRGLGPCGGGTASGRRGAGAGRGLGWRMNLKVENKVENKIKQENNMKIAISSTDKNIESNVSDVFGRCSYFIIAEIKDGKIEKTEAIKNENTDQAGGAGISTAQLMAEKDVNVVITGNVGPRALDVLNQFNIEIYSGEGVVKDVLQNFIDGKLEKVN